MHARPLIAVAMVGALAMQLQAGAQTRGFVGIQNGPPVRPAPPPRVSQPIIPAPIGTNGTIATTERFPGRPSPGFPGGILPGAPEHHRPIRFRSSILGLLIFDPYWWLAPDFSDEIVQPAMLPSGERLSGGLQLDVEPRRAFVYVDGVLVGTVDDFKGYFQHLETSAGYHVLEFLSPDYEPLIVGVTVAPNTTTTYKAFLNRASGR